MAEINAEIDDVIAAMTDENARLGKENAILLARLRNANRIIDFKDAEIERLQSVAAESEMEQQVESALAVVGGDDRS